MLDVDKPTCYNNVTTSQRHTMGNTMKNRTLLWDNGQEYSDHTIYFVDVGEISDESLEVLEQASNGNWPQDLEPDDISFASGFVVAVGHLDWWSGGTTPLSELLMTYSWFGYDFDGTHAPAWKALIATLPDVVAHLESED